MLRSHEGTRSARYRVRGKGVPHLDGAGPGDLVVQ